MPPPIAAGVHGSQGVPMPAISILCETMAVWDRNLVEGDAAADVAGQCGAGGHRRGRGMDFHPTARRMHTDLPAPESCAINRATQTTLESRFWPLAILCTLVALFLQIAVNFANDYSDGVRGVDEGTRSGVARVARVAGIILVGRTDRHPTRGGRPLGPARRASRRPPSMHLRVWSPPGVPPKRVLAAAGGAAALACLCGLAIIAITGYWWLLIIGVCCLLAGWCYTGGRHPYGYAGLGELFVFVFFGLVAVLGPSSCCAELLPRRGCWARCRPACSPACC